MPTPLGMFYAITDFILIAIILFRINWLPDIVNYVLAAILAIYAIYSLATD